MIRCNYTINILASYSKRVLLLILTLVLGTTMWASSTKDSGQYAKAIVEVDPSAAGRVYVDTLTNALAADDVPYNRTALEIQGTKMDVDTWIFGIVTVATYNNITYNIYAEDILHKGYIWGGWYYKETNEFITSSLRTQVTITAAGNADKPTTTTYVAKWLRPKVTSATPTTINFDEITDPTASVTATNVVYTIADYKGHDNYVLSINGDFIHTEADNPIDETNHTYTSSISYTPSGVHGGPYVGEASLASTLHKNGTTYDNSIQTVNLTITENYTPTFSAVYTDPANRYDLGTVALGASQESATGALNTQNNNYAARVLSTTTDPIYGKATWIYTFDEFSIAGQSAANYFSIKDGTGDAGQPIVVFNPGIDPTIYGMVDGEAGEQEVAVRMSVQCLYYDAANKKIASDIQYTYLKATVKQESISVMQFNDGVFGDFGNVVMGEQPSLDLGMYIANIDFADDACRLSGAGKDLFKVSSKPENGKVVVQISDKWEEFAGCDEHTAVLTVTGTRTAPGESEGEVGDQVTVSITLSAILVLSKTPTMVATGSNKAVTFTWDKIIGAKYYDFYYKKTGANNYTKISINQENYTEDSIANLTANDTHYIYTVTFTSNGTQYSAEAYVIAKTATTGGCSKESEHASDNPSQDWIYATNASNPGIKTGINGTNESTNIPNATHRDVNVSAAFDAAGNPIVDRLYIFGETNKNNTSTMLYVYQKEDNGYHLKENLDAQTSRLNSLTIDAQNVSSLYFTGYCPKACTGKSGTLTEGVIHIKGGAKTLHIYINDLQIYAQDNGYLTTLEYDNLDAITKDANNYYSKGKGSVFVFESSSVNETNPFDVRMHIQGFNALDAGKGATCNISISKEGKNLLSDVPVHYCSPICVLPIAAGGVNQRTSLTLDDIWQGQRTHGELRLLELGNDNPQGISIDVGNAGTALTINGGQYQFMPKAAAYRMTTYAVSHQNISIAVNAYGIEGNKNLSSDYTKSATHAIYPARSVALNDGTFNSSSAAINWYTNAFTIDGGSYNTPVEHYTAESTRVAKNYNSDGKELYRAEVEYSDVYGSGTGNESTIITDFAKMVEDIFPHAGINENNYHYPLSVYYVGDQSYGYHSLTLNDNKLYLMVPKMECNTLNMAWQFCTPNMTAEVSGINIPLGGDIEKLKGCKYHETRYEVDRLLYMQLDTFTEKALDDYYLYSQKTRIRLDSEKLYGTINDSTEYVINNKVYMLIPVEAARWILFTPPFNVANVYVIESYPEEQLVKDYNGKRGRIPDNKVQVARDAQAKRFMDLYVYWYQEESGIGDSYDFFDSNSTTDIDGDGIIEPYGPFVLNWMAYEMQNNIGNTAGNYLPVIEKLIHYAGKEAQYPDGKEWYDANYYLYRANGWTLNEDGNFRTNWDVVTVHGGSIMQKGGVYALHFPYNSINGTHNPSATWDYWTGKYVLIESTIGPHTIEGSSSSTSTLKEASSSAKSGTATLSGNASFAEVTITNPVATMWTLDKIAVGEEDNETSRDIHEMIQKSTATIAPAQAVLFANVPAPANMRARTINYQTGEVTYEAIDEEEDTNNPGVGTGIPTIMGDVSLLVVPTEDGLNLIPREAQQVMIFTADGKMLFNKYLSAEEHVNVPTGVYVVRGEKEQVKAIKK